MRGEAICSWSALSHGVFRNNAGVCSQVAQGHGSNAGGFFLLVSGGSVTNLDTNSHVTGGSHFCRSLSGDIMRKLFLGHNSFTFD